MPHGTPRVLASFHVQGVEKRRTTHGLSTLILLPVTDAVKASPRLCRYVEETSSRDRIVQRNVDMFTVPVPLMLGAVGGVPARLSTAIGSEPISSLTLLRQLRQGQDDVFVRRTSTGSVPQFEAASSNASHESLGPL